MRRLKSCSSCYPVKNLPMLGKHAYSKADLHVVAKLQEGGVRLWAKPFMGKIIFNRSRRGSPMILPINYFTKKLSGSRLCPLRRAIGMPLPP